MEIREYLKKKQSLVNEHLDVVLPPVGEGPQKTVIEAMRYSVFAGGKRIRPILCLAGAEAVGEVNEGILSFACAIELIHTYSLIHDDLPGIDNDDLRRGVPTCHKRFGEAAAILAGDALLTEAFSCMTGPEILRHTDAPQLVEAMHVVADAVGVGGMVGGQMADVEAEGKDVSLEAIDYIHRNKTAALIEASVVSGAMLAGASGQAVEAFSRYGVNLGLAFQIRDDILDEIGESTIMGKPQGSDRGRKKATYPSSIGIEESKEREKAAIREAFRALEGGNERCAVLRSIASYLLDRQL